jgi:glutamine amidotransferase
VPAGERLKVPHMGWSPVRQTLAHPLWQAFPMAARFYFAHSYSSRTRRQPIDRRHGRLSDAVYLRSGWANIFATQFHPKRANAQDSTSRQLRQSGR